MSQLLYIPALNTEADISRYEMSPDSVQARMIGLLDGKKTIDDVIGILLLERFGIGDIIQALHSLYEQKIIGESSGSDLSAFTDKEIHSFDNQLKAFASYTFDNKGGLFLPYTPAAINHQKKLKDAVIAVIGKGQDTQFFISNLAAVGVGTVYYNSLDALPADEVEKIKGSGFSKIEYRFINEQETLDEYVKNTPASLIVYISDGFSEQTALDLNTACKENKKDFLVYSKSFPYVFVGPFYRYGKSACYNCYKRRKGGAVNNFARSESFAASDIGFNIPVGLDMLTLEVIKYYTYVLDVSTMENVWTFNVTTGESYLDTVFKLPRCPTCGVHKIKPAKKLWDEI